MIVWVARHGLIVAALAAASLAQAQTAAVQSFTIAGDAIPAPLGGLQGDADQLTVGQAAFRVRYIGAQNQRVCRAVNAHIDKVDLTELIVSAAIRELDPHLLTGPGPDSYLGPGLAVSYFFLWTIGSMGQPVGMVRLMACRDTPTLRRALFTGQLYPQQIGSQTEAPVARSRRSLLGAMRGSPEWRAHWLR